MTKPRVLIAGIGNIFLGDDAFGVEVVRRLTRQRLPENVQVTDYGIRGFDLAYALMDDYEQVVLVDATPRGEAPGTLYVIEPEWDAPEGASVVPDGHGMNPMQVFALVRSLGGKPRRVLLVGCEPSPPAPEDEELGWMGLSPPVEAAVDGAVDKVLSLVNVETLSSRNEGRPV